MGSSLVKSGLEESTLVDVKTVMQICFLVPILIVKLILPFFIDTAKMELETEIAESKGEMLFGKSTEMQMKKLKNKINDGSEIDY